MITASILLILFSALLGASGYGQGTVPTFPYKTGSGVVTLPGADPEHGGTTVIPTLLIPVELQFEAGRRADKPFRLDAAGDVQQVLRSPIFSAASFGAEGETQYADAMLRASVGSAAGASAEWHTLLGRPQIRPITVRIPAGYGYVLSSKQNGTELGMADAEFVQREIFKQLPRQDGKLVIAVTHNTAYYTYGDATVCCSWGTHGVDGATGNSFVMASYLGTVPPLVEEHDVQPLTEQLAQWVNDPLHDPLFHVEFRRPLPQAENVVPSWRWPATEGTEHRGCGGNSPATRYTLQSPLNTNERSNLPTGRAFVTRADGEAWHLANAALMSWYTGGPAPYSFPDSQILAVAAVPCSPSEVEGMGVEPAPASPVAPVPADGSNNGHELIGYWTGMGRGGTRLRLRDVSPQWDVIIVAFADVNHQAPEGTMRLRVGPMAGLPGAPQIDLAQMKEDIAWLKSRGKTVLISLGGGGEYFTLAQKASIPTFVNSVTQIVTQYGFDGVDLDFESPSLVLDPGDVDFRHPTTPSIVNLLAALRELREHFGPRFVLSLVPEGPQIAGGYVGYGGQFGSYLPLVWGVRDILSFVDMQDYNTPPFEGLDGEIYQLGSVNYDAAMTELLLQGFPVNRRAQNFFPPVSADKVAVGFLVGTATPELASGAMQYLITGNAPQGVTYRLRRPGGYSAMIGAMFWTIDGDRDENFSFSNRVGPQLHGYPSSLRDAGRSKSQ